MLSWCYLGAILGPLGTMVPLLYFLLISARIFKNLCFVYAKCLFWNLLTLAVSLATFGVSLGPSWAILGYLEATLEPSWAILG